MTTVSFIGAGNMGAALIRGLNRLDGVRLVAYDLDREKLNVLCAECGAQAVGSPAEAVALGDYVVLCVKPQQMKGVVKEIHSSLSGGKCLVSIAAGVTLGSLGKWVGSCCPVVRVMPNTPALVGAGVVAVCLEDPQLSREQKDFVLAMFASVGAVHDLAEKQFDAFTAVAGSGPAYVFYFMEAVIEAAVASGLPRQQATEITMELFAGSVKLAKESNIHLSLLREMVTSPAGTTVAALSHMDRQAVRGAIIDAVEHAVKRGKKLGD